MALSETSSNKVDKRTLVVVGDLPQDFLRIRPHPQQSALSPLSWESGMDFEFKDSIKLSINIAQAQLTKNYGLTRMDPYLKLIVGKTVFETPTAVNGAKNPIWNKVIIMILPAKINEIIIEIYDERTITPDSKLAWTTIRIPDSVYYGDQLNNWFPLTGAQGQDKEGSVNLIFTLLSNPEEAIRIKSPYFTHSNNNKNINITDNNNNNNNDKNNDNNNNINSNNNDDILNQSFNDGSFDEDEEINKKLLKKIKNVNNSNYDNNTNTTTSTNNNNNNNNNQNPSNPTNLNNKTIKHPNNNNNNNLNEEEIKENEKKLKDLKEMFPALEEEVVRGVLQACCGSVNGAINSLLEMQG